MRFVVVVVVVVVFFCFVYLFVYFCLIFFIELSLPTAIQSSGLTNGYKYWYIISVVDIPTYNLPTFFFFFLYYLLITPKWRKKESTPGVTPLRNHTCEIGEAKKSMVGQTTCVYVSQIFRVRCPE